jgi:hypothetical protein
MITKLKSMIHESCGVKTLMATIVSVDLRPPFNRELIRLLSPQERDK